MGLFDRIANLFGLKKHEVKVLVVGLNNSGKSTVLNHLKSDDDKSTEVVPTVGFSVEKFKKAELTSARKALQKRFNKATPVTGIRSYHAVPLGQGRALFKNYSLDNAGTEIEFHPAGQRNPERTDGGVGFTALDMSGQGRYRSLWEHYYRECHGVMFVVDAADRLRLAVARHELDLVLQHPDVIGRPLPLLFLANKSDCRDALSAVKVAAALGLDRILDKPWHICASNALTGEGLDEGITWFTQQLRHQAEHSSSK